MEIEVRLFGSLKKLAENGRLVVACPSPPSAKDLREQIAEMLSTRPGFRDDVVRRSALAVSSKVLTDGEVVAESVVMLLPPVCGG